MIVRTVACLSCLAGVVAMGTSEDNVSFPSAVTPQSSLPSPPKGGVWLFGVQAYTPITDLYAYSVELTYPSGSKILSSHTIPLKYNSSLVPTTRDWAQDTVNGRLVMWHTIYGGSECALETVSVPDHASGKPTLESTWVVPAKYCVAGAQLALNPRERTAVYVVARLDTHPTTNPTVLKITGPSGTGPARVSVVSTRIPLGVWGPIAIDPYFHNLHIINTSLLVSTQNVVTVSTISGDVTVDPRAISTTTTRLSSVQFNPKKMGKAMGSANYNSQSGRIALVDPSTSPWTVSPLGYTPSAYTFQFDFTSTPVTAYGGSPSWCNWYDPSHSNPPLGVIVISGSWNTGTVFPYMK